MPISPDRRSGQATNRPEIAIAFTEHESPLPAPRPERETRAAHAGSMQGWAFTVGGPLGFLLSG